MELCLILGHNRNGRPLKEPQNQNLCLCSSHPAGGFHPGIVTRRTTRGSTSVECLGEHLGQQLPPGCVTQDRHHQLHPQSRVGTPSDGDAPRPLRSVFHAATTDQEP